MLMETNSGIITSQIGSEYDKGTQVKFGSPTDTCQLHEFRNLCEKISDKDTICSFLVDQRDIAYIEELRPGVRSVNP